MQLLKEVLIDQLRDLLHAEKSLIAALPKMAQAAHAPKLREAFEKHLAQTEGQAERLNQIFELLEEQPSAKTCKAMVGLIDEAKETMSEWSSKGELAADLALIAAAQRVEHYEIAAYGTARTLAHQCGEKEAARLLGYTLGEEESTDFLLTEVAKPLLQNAAQEDERVGETTAPRKRTAGH
jgi:Mn-containing catalase